ncbi:DUF1127 domain-containing protein [Chachezhania antarctica]|mgnify:CR=1 FL=1|uniref:DUF1127 domain-containing protein n=1 Tax=Chachezhania antarctica TaxID=2340860 RepID=UPI000EB2B3CE|nr:DUF1127 domain-containing protein [Chachezhania antarctica]|tara:strand:- start:6099 stop:6323 length:225 start_codon:yes stop_codon:yes gene_type:complete
MAHITANVPAGRNVQNAFSRFFSAIGNGLVVMAENNSKMKQIRALEALSDADLAKRGIKREDIARHVLSPGYWI